MGKKITEIYKEEKQAMNDRISREKTVNGEKLIMLPDKSLEYKGIKIGFLETLTLVEMISNYYTNGKHVVFLQDYLEDFE